MTFFMGSVIPMAGVEHVRMLLPGGIHCGGQAETASTSLYNDFEAPLAA